MGIEKISPKKMENMILSNEKQIERLIRLVDDMLDVSRLNLGKLQLEKNELNMSSLIEEVFERFQPQFELKDIDLKLDVEANIFVWVDKFKIEQVMANLLTNAMKYGNEKPVQISVRKYPERVEVRVIDQGLGIPEDQLRKVFDQFERISTNVASGLGLGLYISKQIIEAHHGEIWAESDGKSGSVFIFSLPLSQYKAI